MGGGFGWSGRSPGYGEGDVGAGGSVLEVHIDVDGKECGVACGLAVCVVIWAVDQRGLSCCLRFSLEVEGGPLGLGQPVKLSPR